ncbi:thioesterase [Streptomyces sp. SID14515]|uniref:thioesterase n=1 Tax=Streptomyces sp. SID14515 TaxID=2706074 RepID=UPI0013C5887B|nr:thioesterase [Streptomyces sp. SID14515]
MTTRLICLPYAGAGAGVYRRWKALSTPDLTAVPIQLPGREEEFGQPFYPTFEAAVHGTADRVLAAVGSGPFAVFGHSFGGALAHGVTRELVARGGPRPRRLIVSGTVSPRHRSPLPISATDDAQAVADLCSVTGQSLTGDLAPLLDPELRTLLLPALRADVTLLAPDPDRGPEPLPVPLTAIRGTDDVLAPTEPWLDWAAYTSQPFRAVDRPGGHMYLADDWDAAWRTVRELI